MLTESHGIRGAAFVGNYLPRVCGIATFTYDLCENVAKEIGHDNKTFAVKPFVLVVAKDTQHAGQLRELIASKGFFEGRYANNVMEIHSNQRGSEKDENIEKLLSLCGTGSAPKIAVN